MEYESQLVEAGLNRWEARTYISLLELGSTTTGPLVKKCEVPHSKIYSVLESLIKKGFASYVVKGKIKYFQATNPEIILSVLKEKEKKVSEIMPNLKTLQQYSQKKQDVEILEGMKAITHLYMDLIEGMKKGDEWLSFSIGSDELLGKTQTFYDKIGILRAEKHLNVKLLNNIKYKKQIKEVYSDRWKWISNVMRFSNSTFPATTLIVKGKVIIVNFLSEPETAIVIKSNEIYSHYKSYFSLLWSSAKR
jgi:sugar-specific transcriptional regulator TrmB